MNIDLGSLNLLDKWIVEHGAAKVMGMHIALLREQLTALDRESTNLKGEVSSLKATIKDLSEECQRRAARIHELEVAAQQKEKEESGEMPELHLKMMKVMLHNPDGVSENALADGFHISAALAKFHLRKLMADGLVWQDAATYNDWSLWGLTHKGDDYLGERGLL